MMLIESMPLNQQSQHLLARHSFRKAVDAAGVLYTYASCNFFAGYFFPTLAQPGVTAPTRGKVLIQLTANQEGVNKLLRNYQQNGCITEQTIKMMQVRVWKGLKDPGHIRSGRSAIREIVLFGRVEFAMLLWLGYLHKSTDWISIQQLPWRSTLRIQVISWSYKSTCWDYEEVCSRCSF